MAGEQPFDATTVRERVRELPGGRELLRVAAHWGEVELVGGAVRDILLDRRAALREFDLVVAENAHGLADALAKELGVLSGENPQERFESQLHDRFRTAIVSNDQIQIDIATRRRETYACPGALPDVKTGTPEEDLLRRDFTVNAIAVRIDEGRAGEVHAAPGALEDLAAGRLRVLHDASFIDDPTRLLRLARYEARLRFVVEDHTAALAREAIAARAFDTVSGARIGAELRLGLAEDSALEALQRMDELGILLALGLHTPLPEKLAAGALALLPDDGRPGELLMALLCEDPAILDTFEFSAGERDRIVSSARAAPQIGDVLASDTRASLLHGALAGKTPEAIAIAAAHGQPGAAETARLWFDTLRHVRLSITGDDLLAAGVPSGPELGRRLAVALARRLDGELEPGPRAELAAAMEAGA
jgi:tRNA nucleotidyltransferase (CCA-adding enzyme)